MGMSVALLIWLIQPSRQPMLRIILRSVAAKNWCGPMNWSPVIASSSARVTSRKGLSTRYRWCRAS